MRSNGKISIVAALNHGSTMLTTGGSTMLTTGGSTMLTTGGSTGLTRAKRTGSIVVLYMMILSTLITGAVATVAVLSNSETQSSSVGFDRDQAFYAAEAGIQRAVWNANHNSSPSTWLASLPLTATMPNGSTYKITSGTVNWPASPVTFQCIGNSADGLVTSQASAKITSSGYCPGMATGKDFTCNGTMNIGGDFNVVGNVIRNGNTTLTAANGQGGSLKATGSFAINGTTSIAGDFMFNSSIQVNGTTTVGGNFSTGSTVTGNGALTIAGNAVAAGQINTGGQVSITGNLQTSTTPSYTGSFKVGGTESIQATTGPNLTISVPTVDTATLISEATADGTVTTLTNGQANSGALNINLNTGSHHVWLIKSNVTNGPITFNGGIYASGTGTVIVQGSATTFNGPFALNSGGASATSNLVTTSDMTINGNITLTGSLCVGGNFTRNGTTTITGGVSVIQGQLMNSGNITSTYGTPPSFISWGTGSSGSTVTVSNFMGPMY
jgi:hypothetical protein